MPNRILDTVDIVRLGRELQAARKQAKLTQEDAANIIGVARTTITAIEKGDRRIKEGELIKLCRAYGRSVSDFVRPRPVIEDVSIREIQFRGPFVRTEEDEDAISTSIDELLDLCRDYLELEELLEAPLTQNYPPEYRYGRLPIEQAAETIALEERNRLRLGDGPLPILRDILEGDVGLRIFYLPLRPSRFSAIYFYTEQLGGCIALNSSHPEDRCRWSLAHDYLHFLTTRYKPDLYLGQGQGYKRVPESERLADLFADNFLMPASGLIRRFNELREREGKVSVGPLATLAHQYGVSMQAMFRRLETLKLIPTATWEKLKDDGLKVREIQRKLGLDEIPARRDLLPVHYQQLAIQAYAEARITEGQLSRFLRRDRWETRQALALETSGFAETFDEIDEDSPASAPGTDTFLRGQSTGV
jgi:Zn-dependent peptidase ImmA (M78 family)/DNA-binding XRE family transcriptional regulator